MSRTIDQSQRRSRSNRVVSARAMHALACVPAASPDETPDTRARSYAIVNSRRASRDPVVAPRRREDFLTQFEIPRGIGGIQRREPIGERPRRLARPPRVGLGRTRRLRRRRAAPEHGDRRKLDEISNIPCAHTQHHQMPSSSLATHSRSMKRSVRSIWRSTLRVRPRAVINSSSSDSTSAARPGPSPAITSAIASASAS